MKTEVLHNVHSLWHFTQNFQGVNHQESHTCTTFREETNHTLSHWIEHNRRLLWLSMLPKIYTHIDLKFRPIRMIIIKGPITTNPDWKILQHYLLYYKFTSSIGTDQSNSRRRYYPTNSGRKWRESSFERKEAANNN